MNYGVCGTFPIPVGMIKMQAVSKMSTSKIHKIGLLLLHMISPTI